MKAGDEPYVAAREGNLLHLAWYGERNEIAPTELGAECRITMDGAAGVIYDCWTPPLHRGKGIYPAVLSALLQQCFTRHGEIWIYCLESNTASRKAIEKVGFRLRKHMIRSRLAGRCVYEVQTASGQV